MRDQVLPGFKLLDIEITNSYPLIALTPRTNLICSERRYLINNYNHLTIPPDFRLHLTSLCNRVFFDIASLQDFLYGKGTSLFHYFTVVGLPSSRALPLIPPEKTRTWHGAMIISPFKDEKFNSSTRLFIDFFLHYLPMNFNTVYRAPFAAPNMRLAFDRHGAIIGPHSFADMQRRKKPEQDVFFTMRFGFVEFPNDEEMYIFTPLKFFKKESQRDIPRRY